MALRDLVTFAQQHIPHPPLGEDRRLPPPTFVSNLAHGERAPYPDWLKDPAAEAIQVDSLGNLEINDEAIAAVLGAERLRGGLPGIHESTYTDTLAYYLPYHFHCDGVWGIYLRALGIAYLASAIKGSSVGREDSILVKAAEHVLFNHEAYHCQVEAAATRAEIVAGRPVYHPYFDDNRAGLHEEALANAQAYRQLVRAFPAYAKPVRDWMCRQGVGYRDFDKYIKAREFNGGQQICGRHIIRQLPPNRSLPARTPADFLFGKASPKSIPTFLVVEQAISQYVLRPFPNFKGVVVKVHSREHPPPHIHIEMPVGRQITKYVWDEPLRPVAGERELSSKEEKKFIKYLQEFGRAIHEDVCKKYPQHVLQMPVFSIRRPVLAQT